MCRYINTTKMAVRLETKDLIQEADELTKRNAQLRCQILEKQKKISSLEIESATLSQVVTFFGFSSILSVLILRHALSIIFTGIIFDVTDPRRCSMRGELHSSFSKF